MHQQLPPQQQPQMEEEAAARREGGREETGVALASPAASGGGGVRGWWGRTTGKETWGLHDLPVETVAYSRFTDDTASNTRFLMYVSVWVGWVIEVFISFALVPMSHLYTHTQTKRLPSSVLGLHHRPRGHAHSQQRSGPRSFWIQ